MNITKDLVKKLAKLSNLSITDSKLDLFTNQLKDIFQYFESLKEIDTTHIEYASFNENNALRNDIPKNNESERINILKNVPNIKNGYVRTKSVLGKVT